MDIEVQTSSIRSAPTGGGTLDLPREIDSVEGTLSKFNE